MVVRKTALFISVVSGDDALHEHMADHVGGREAADLDILHAVEHADGLFQAADLVARQVDLRDIAGNDDLRAPLDKGSLVRRFADGLDLRLDADGFVHELVEVVFGHGGEDTVDGVLEDGVALADGDADVDVFGAFSLTALGLTVCRSQANYLLFRGPAGLDAALLRQKIAIRSCANYPGLGEGWYRTAVRLPEENEALLDALRRGMEELSWR